MLLCDPCGWGQCSAVQPRRSCSAAHWPVWFAPVCVVGVVGGCVGRLALSGRPGFRSVCVSLFHVENPVQWTRNYQRRRSLSGAIAVQTFTKVKGSDRASFAHKGKWTSCGKLLLVHFPAHCADCLTIPWVSLSLRKKVKITPKSLLALALPNLKLQTWMHKLSSTYCIIKLKDPQKDE